VSFGASWGVEPLNPHVQSARGGWHVYFAVPDNIDPAALRQPDAIKDVINVRCIGYTVAAGSYWNDEQGQALPYALLHGAAPYTAPAGLIEHCTRKPNKNVGVTLPGSREIEDVKELLRWLSERGAFDAYEDWVAIGMALKLEYGDGGLAAWQITFDADEQTPDLAAAKWDSFSSEPDAHSVTLNTFLDRAHKLGWRGQVRKSLGAMFGGVAQLAAGAGVTSLPSGAPVPIGALPMMAGQAELARIGEPLLADFMSTTNDAPTNPVVLDIPELPADQSSHGLFAEMQAAIRRVFALAGQEKFKPARIVDPLAILHEMHAPTYDAVARRLQGMGINVPQNKVRQRAQNIQEEVQRVTVTFEKWEYDPKSGAIESDNPDNVRFGLEYLGMELRWNAWSSACR
jgi:hypothetical protein